MKKTVDIYSDIYSRNQQPFSNRGSTFKTIEEYLTVFWGRRVCVLSSARVGIYQSLGFFQLRRLDHILVPDFLCQFMLSILNTSSFPVKYLDNRTKAILLLHQWGYPQKMDEVLLRAREQNLFIIEDCVHSFDSTYKGKKIGTFGNLAVFSFSKLFPTYIGGALVSSDKSLIDYIKKERERKKNLYDKLFNELAFLTAKKSFDKGKWRSLRDIVYLKNIYFPNINKKALRLFPPTLSQLKQVLQQRKRNYLFLKNNIKREYLVPDWDSDIEVNPLCIPVFLPLNKLEKAQKILNKNSINAEILHFDINRNIFNPLYRKCLAVPCHQFLNDKWLFLITETINKV